jgi:hypothetical protein
MITVALIGLSYLGVGILIGRHLKVGRESLCPTMPCRNRESIVEDDLVLRLNSLLHPHLGKKLDDDSAARLQALLGELARIVGQTQLSCGTTNHNQSEDELDAAGIGTADWFPVTPLPDADPGATHRQARRFTYARWQAVAPVVNDELPGPSAFVEVLFHDLSTSGFSFYAMEEFTVEKLIAKLGVPPNTVPVLARVLRQNEAWHDGRWMFRVACEIIRKLDNPYAGSTALLELCGREAVPNCETACV